jgi:hypothetical protein
MKYLLIFFLSLSASAGSIYQFCGEPQLSDNKAKESFFQEFSQIEAEQVIIHSSLTYYVNDDNLIQACSVVEEIFNSKDH